MNENLINAPAHQIHPYIVLVILIGYKCDRQTLFAYFALQNILPDCTEYVPDIHGLQSDTPAEGNRASSRTMHQEHMRDPGTIPFLESYNC